MAARRPVRPRQPSNADIYVEFGRLAAGVEGLREDFNASQDQARQHRSTVYSRFDDASRRLDTLEGQMKRVEPAVQAFTNLKMKAIGAVAVLLAIGSIAGATYWMAEIKPFLWRIMVR
jgi:hypothetical protein